MIVSDLIIHPIKSLNGIHVSAAKICEYGFENDRIFMIVREQPDHSHRLLHIGAVSALALFRTSIVDFNIVVSSPEGALLVPLNPDTRGLKRVYICMAETDLWAYDMGFDYNLFFRKTLGPNVKLLFGGGTRPTAMNKPSHWLFRQKIALHFTAPILLTSASSLADVNKRASSSTDMEKFRPNIVVDGAAAWDEDYWSEVRIAGNLRVPLTAPCNRCRSITVDYITGKFGTAGQPLKSMQSYRRIDKNYKYTPIFGRYGYIFPKGSTIRVGDSVTVVRRNKEYDALVKLECDEISPALEYKTQWHMLGSRSG